jgi:hypothetical protein
VGFSHCCKFDCVAERQSSINGRTTTQRPEAITAANSIKDHREATTDLLKTIALMKRLEQSSANPSVQYHGQPTTLERLPLRLAGIPAPNVPTLLPEVPKSVTWRPKWEGGGFKPTVFRFNDQFVGSTTLKPTGFRSVSNQLVRPSTNAHQKEQYRPIINRIRLNSPTYVNDKLRIPLSSNFFVAGQAKHQSHYPQTSQLTGNTLRRNKGFAGSDASRTPGFPRNFNSPSGKTKRFLYLETSGWRPVKVLSRARRDPEESSDNAEDGSLYRELLH